MGNGAARPTEHIESLSGNSMHEKKTRAGINCATLPWGLWSLYRWPWSPRPRLFEGRRVPTATWSLSFFPSNLRVDLKRGNHLCLPVASLRMLHSH